MSGPEYWSVEVQPREAGVGPRTRELTRILASLTLPDISPRDNRLYLFAGHRSTNLDTAIKRLCIDPVLANVAPDATQPGWTIDLLPAPGVTDAEGDTLAAALARDGFSGVQVRTGFRISLSGAVDAEIAAEIARRLAHPVVEHASVSSADQPNPSRTLQRWFESSAGALDAVESVPLRDLDDDALLALSRHRLLALSLEDLRAIRNQFVALNREPTDVELETVAQTWSEHCAHRTFRATIEHRDDDGPIETIPGLLKTYLAAATDQINKPWVLSAFKDNAGVIVFDDDWEVSFKVETHNHPSAIEPFGGANTGVGGVVRDVLGVSAEPIANTNVLCFGPPDTDPATLATGVLEPSRVLDGVIAGIADYGNKMGIPTVNGAVLFDHGFTANPLVFCGTVGLAPRGYRPIEAAVDDLIVVVGGRTGRDGIHGATFSSEVLDAGAVPELGSVVQIGDPIVEKQLADALAVARDERLYSAITDCGAGGLSSAAGEMAADLGAQIELAQVPLKYAGLRPWEIWLSEAQERMVLAVPPDRWPRLQEVFEAEGVEATAIGSFTGDGKLVVRSEGRVVADLDCRFLHTGAPVRTLTSVWGSENKPEHASTASESLDLNAALIAVLSDLNVASKEPVVRRYDHEVQGRTVGKPFVGPLDIGPADAAVLRPVASSTRGVAIGNGVNPWYGELDPYEMALLVIDEALRNVVAAGADPERVAILDNFCWGNPNLPDRLGGLVRAVRGCRDAAVALGLPFVSGKDSLYNEYRDLQGASRSIPGTLLISAIGIVPDVRRTVSTPFKFAGNPLYLIGATGNDLGGSIFARINGFHGGRAPVSHLEPQRVLYVALHQAMQTGLVLACHDLSDGGLAVTLAEMAIGSGLGADVQLVGISPHQPELTPATVLFSETPGRFVLEVRGEDAEALEQLLADHIWTRIGTVSAEPGLRALTGERHVLAVRGPSIADAWSLPLVKEIG